MSSFSDRERFEREHRWATDRMSEYLDGEFSARERGRMEHHLSECGNCRRLLMGLRRTLDLLQRLSAPAEELDPQNIAASVRVRLASLE